MPPRGTRKARVPGAGVLRPMAAVRLTHLLAAAATERGFRSRSLKPEEHESYRQKVTAVV